MFEDEIVRIRGVRSLNDRKIFTVSDFDNDGELLEIIITSSKLSELTSKTAEELTFSELKSLVENNQEGYFDFVRGRTNAIA